jgi:TolB-like protein/DNA-binding winged helix-turn-helix (wHTH) protein
LSQLNHTPVYTVGDLRIDTGQARVRRGVTEIPLPKLSFDLLLALIEAAPRIASIDELMERVWPGLVVSPETVNQRVSLLRAALEDSPKGPKYIAVVRRRGYRLVAAVIREDLTPDSPSGPLATSGPRRAPESEANASVTAGPVVRASVRRACLWGVLGLATAAVAVLITVSRFQSEPAPVTSNAAPPERSIAVLPFENVGSTKEGTTLAPGIAEAVLHQLASVRELTVVARTSSFAFADRKEDVREIGRKLSARYLLEGSVQMDDKRMRVTAELIDTMTGSQVWSVRIDKTPRDIFAVQDEIALEVARALKLSLDASTTDKLTGQGTANFDAYLAYLQGRAHAVTLRVAELKQAVAEFSRATNVDPSFASAYVELADAGLLVAEYDPGEGREEKFAAAVERGKGLVERALQLDPANSHAYVERAYLRAFDDLAGAESDYRRGIALSPSYAKAYAGLAAVLYESPARWRQALEALDRARTLDPLEPQYDVTKAVFLFYRRSDIQGASDLLVDLVQREPLYQPALMRLGELRWQIGGRLAEAIKYAEQALSLDPHSEWTRRYLQRAYLDLGDSSSAAEVARTAPTELAIRSLPLHLYRQQWRLAAEVAYAAEEDGTLAALDEFMATFALRIQARTTGDYARCIATLERISEISWDDAGRPHLPARLGMMISAVALADMLQQSGDAMRAQRLLHLILAEMDHAARDLQRGEFWYQGERALALMLLGDGKGSLQALERTFSEGSIAPDWYLLEFEPAYTSLHGEPRFQRLLERARIHAAKERETLAQLRAEGIVPARLSGAGARTDPQSR